MKTNKLDSALSEDEVVEGNKLICGLMGTKYGPPPGMVGGLAPLHVYTRMLAEETKYHSDWKMLMKVVEQIESLGYFCMINKWTSIYKSEGQERSSISTFEGESKILNTFKAVVKFIKWHNTQTKNLITVKKGAGKTGSLETKESDSVNWWDSVKHEGLRKDIEEGNKDYFKIVGGACAITSFVNGKMSHSYYYINDVNKGLSGMDMILHDVKLLKKHGLIK